MNNSPTHDFASQNGLTLQAQDIVSGLGLARRELLATCLALFEDSTLQQRLSERTDEVLKWSSQVLGNHALLNSPFEPITHLEFYVQPAFPLEF